jgi:hypothetical protein
VLAAGLAGWLALVAGPDAAWPVAGLGAVAAVGLAGILTVGRPEPIVGALVLLAAAYVMVLVIDDPPLDARAALVGATLLAIGELAHLSVEARSVVTNEAGAVARRIASVAVLALLALFLGGAILALVDLARAGGLAIEVIGGLGSDTFNVGGSNGEAVTRMDLDEWTAPNKRPDGSDHKFDIAYKDHPRKGFIGLQDHGQNCWYKNIKLLALK